MMPRYLLDTNILSEVIKPTPVHSVINAVAHHKKSLATATIVLHEIMYGCFRLPPSKRRTNIQQYIETVILSELPIFPYDENAARWHAQQRADLARQGTTPSFIDGQIAAIAKTNELILVTRNISDFRYFLDLQVENWVDG
ncbi:twitching motility protein PilT [Achromatium sp. WMS3]|nr:twitching motility protein PilT [Achromatium sp. WMS3]